MAKPNRQQRVGDRPAHMYHTLINIIFVLEIKNSMSKLQTGSPLSLPSRSITGYITPYDDISVACRNFADKLTNKQTLAKHDFLDGVNILPKC